MEITDLNSTFGILGAIVTIVGGQYKFYKWSFSRGYKSASHSEEKILFEQLYSPLRASLIHTRFVSCSSISYPRLSQRVTNAWEAVITRKYLKGKIKGAIKALSYRGESLTVECDTGFPQAAITEIVQKASHLVDRDLMDKIHDIEVMSSCPCDFDEQDILKAQYHLFSYILKKYEDLAKKFT